jgi:hypothetical protein
MTPYIYITDRVGKAWRLRPADGGGSFRTDSFYRAHLAMRSASRFVVESIAKKNNRQNVSR